MRHALTVLVFAACGSPREPGPQPRPIAPGPRPAAPTADRPVAPAPGLPVAPARGWLVVAPTAPLGSLALALAPTPATPASPLGEVADSVLPARDASSVASVGALAPGARVSVLGMVGGPVAYTAGTRAQVPYGCDGNTLEVTPLAGPAQPRGVAWVLPAPLPAGWAPAALAVTWTRRERARVGLRIGDLDLELVRTAPLRGTLTLARAGRVIHRAAFERTLMDGAPPELATIDLTDLGGPGVPLPVGAWTLAPGGPVLLALALPGFEGVTLSGLLVHEAGAAPVPGLEKYLYGCAF